MRRGVLSILLVPRNTVFSNRYGDYRGYVAKDGQCVNNQGQTTGFLNLEVSSLA